jgi:alkyl sulfatase BDS1-like metallo-beta-lactamase superfamily hydrolase
MQQEQLQENNMPKSATEATRRANADLLNRLPFDNTQDYADARRGLIVETPDLVIRNEAGEPFWDMKSYYDFLGGGAKAPDTVNPSYWRHEQLGALAGLFEVTDGVWQVRGYDLANMTLIRSNTGYIIVDPLGAAETARAALALAFQHLGKKPIVAVVITHSHFDHFGGLEGVVSIDDVVSGAIPVIAPDGFNEAVVSENIFAGRAMNRRACYQFGPQLPHGPQGLVGTSMGSGGKSGLIFPNTFVLRTGERMTIDGVEFVFQLTLDSESPAQMCFHLPQFRALCMADITVYTLHNLLPFRGAQVRSGKLWAHHIHEALELFGDVSDVLFICHHWPCWGRDRIANFLRKQRDIYKFINDQTVRRINHGQTMAEIAEEVDLPDGLGLEWFNRSYYGHVNHDIKATYQRYLGWFDANPAHLHELPPVEASRRYVEFMGGADAVLRRARAYFDQGDYRWVAQVVNHVVFADPENREARELQADALEQLGYQAESSTWRSCYLNGAMELRGGIKKVPMSPIGLSAVANMPTELLLDYLATQVDPARAGDRPIRLNLLFYAPREDWQWTLENAVMNCWDKPLQQADAEYMLTRDTFNRIACRQISARKAIDSGAVQARGDKDALARMFGVLEDLPDFWFNIVTP